MYDNSINLRLAWRKCLVFNWVSQNTLNCWEIVQLINNKTEVKYFETGVVSVGIELLSASLFEKNRKTKGTFGL